MGGNLFNIDKFLSNFVCKYVIITQDGFLRSRFFIEEFTYSINYEILNITDNNGNCYLSINLNQVYNFEFSDSFLKFYIDNDTIIILSLKNEF